VRASLEGFGTTITGVVMSGYYIGLIFGCWLAPKMVARVGHIRIFGAMASLASTSILLQVVFINPWIWLVMRIVTGFSYAGIYIVAESWLNEASENDSRGQLLSVYMLVSSGGLAGGQFLLNIALPTGFELFVLVSMLVSLALIPILTSVTKAPSFDVYESVGILQLYRVSPIGIVGMFITGMTMGGIFGMGAVYTTEIGKSVQEVSFFMGAIILGGFLFQYPLGWISDRIGRRSVIVFSSAMGGVISFYAMTHSGEGILFFGIIAAIGGLSMPIYSLCSAQTNDHLTPQQMVAASGTLVLVNSIGAALGAPTVAISMEFFGTDAFFGSLGIMMSLVTLYALWRSTQRADIAAEDRGEFVVMAPTPLSVSLTLDVELEAVEAAVAEKAEDVQASFEDLTTELQNPNAE
jgi:MFS family permease